MVVQTAANNLSASQRALFSWLVLSEMLQAVAVAQHKRAHVVARRVQQRRQAQSVAWSAWVFKTDKILPCANRWRKLSVQLAKI